MGNYLNQDGKKFYEITHSDIYVDKTELLTYTNSVLQTLQKYICISRPRRFGKSITASMIAAYYSRGCDAKELFSPYKIARNLDFDTYRNKYNKCQRKHHPYDGSFGKSFYRIGPDTGCDQQCIKRDEFIWQKCRQCTDQVVFSCVSNRKSVCNVLGFIPWI